MPELQNVTSFLTLMAALSTAVQAMVDHLIKRRILWLDTPNGDRARENRRQSLIHFLAFFLGAALAWSVEIKPLSFFGITQGLTANSLTAGLLVSFGGSFFNELLGAVREFKKAQASLQKARG